MDEITIRMSVEEAKDIGRALSDHLDCMKGREGRMIIAVMGAVILSKVNKIEAAELLKQVKGEV